VIVAGLAAIYLLPFLVPVHDGLSDSWLFGFSNRTAIVLITVFVLGFAIWARGLGLRLPDRAAPANTGFRATAWIAIAASGVGCLCFWALGRMMVPLMESQYFLDRYEMFRQGGRLFQDFEFDYGPLLFYPAVWIAKLTHLSLGNAYFLSWTLQCVLGTWVLWKVVDVTARGTAHARTIFLLLWLFFLTALPDSGSNYTPLRYCGTLGVALAVHALYARGAAGIKVFGLAGLGGTVLLLYSPEQGIAFMLATIFFFALCVRRTWADLFPAFALFVFGMAAVLVLSLRMGLLSNTLIVGNGGGLNFPLLISFQSVVVLLLLLVAGCVFISGFISGAPDGPLSYLICVSAILAPAAFSRADSGHMVLNLLGALIAALVVLSQYRTLWRWTWLSFALFLLLFTFGKFNLYAGTVKFQLHDSVFGSQYPSPALTRAYVAVYKLTHKNAEARLQTLRAQSMDPQQDAATPLPAGARLLAPLGAQRRLTPLPNGIEIVSGYYPWMFPMATTDAVPRKIAELNAHPGWPLILPSRDRQVCVFDADLERASLRRFLLALYVPRPRGQLTAAKPFCDFLNQHYAPSAYASPLPRSYIWVRRDGNAGN
jgi:hypothetical protein